jgi:hypothetical protein
VTLEAALELWRMKKNIIKNRWINKWLSDGATWRVMLIKLTCVTDVSEQ